MEMSRSCWISDEQYMHVCLCRNVIICLQFRVKYAVNICNRLNVRIGKEMGMNLHSWSKNICFLHCCFVWVAADNAGFSGGP